MTSPNPFDAIAKFFDPYSRVARLYPCLIAIAPALWSALALFPSILENASRSAAFVVATTCVFYFLTSLTRSLGKRAETRLLARWNGWPSTTTLRHRDAWLDPVTKARYHQALEAMSGVTLPTAAQELQDPKSADDLYRSATKKLIEQRRGPKYQLLHNENASYGFRRNLYGLKPVALMEVCILLSLTAFGWWLITPQPYTRLIVAQSVLNYPHFPVLIALDIFYVTLWLWAVTSGFVRQAGQEYADALLRTLDS